MPKMMIDPQFSYPLPELLCRATRLAQLAHLVDPESLVLPRISVHNAGMLNPIHAMPYRSKTPVPCHVSLPTTRQLRILDVILEKNKQMEAMPIFQGAVTNSCL